MLRPHSRVFKVTELHLLASRSLQPTGTQKDHLGYKTGSFGCWCGSTVHLVCCLTHLKVSADSILLHVLRSPLEVMIYSSYILSGFGFPQHSLIVMSGEGLQRWMKRTRELHADKGSGQKPNRGSRGFTLPFTCQTIIGLYRGHSLISMHSMALSNMAKRVTTSHRRSEVWI